jgi:hypothetical protein
VEHVALASNSNHLIWSAVPSRGITANLVGAVVDPGRHRAAGGEALEVGIDRDEGEDRPVFRQQEVCAPG